MVEGRGMHLVRFKRSVETFKKNGVYLFDNENIKRIPLSLYDSIPYNSIRPFTNQSTLLLVRSGGIGDIIAMSVLSKVAKRVIFLTQKKYAPYLNLWTRPPQIKHFGEPLFMAGSLDELIFNTRDLARLSGEDTIELGSKENWYDIFLKSAGQPTGSQRPDIQRPPHSYKTGCLIVSKAGMINRTANRIDIENAARNHFSVVINTEDMNWTTQEYIEALASFAYCITTDTSALHIREGFGLPALGLFGPFVKDSRSSGYVYTHSIQIDSGCPPCHIHNKQPCHKNQGTPFAPCLSNMAEQINRELHTILQ